MAVEVNPDNWTMTISGYEIDLEKMTKPAKMLDTIFQVATKRHDWISDADIGRMIRLIAILIDPQATLCGCGVARNMKAGEIQRILERSSRSDWLLNELARGA